MDKSNPSQVDEATRESSKDDQIRELHEMNAKLLAILETQGANKHDEEGKIYKRLAAHKPRSYDGEADPVKFEDWVSYMSKLLYVVNCPEGMKVRLASFYLKGPADLWWLTLKEIAKQPEFTWEWFVEKLREKFFPPALRRMKESEFLSLRQGKMTVLEYAAKFIELSRFASDIVKCERLQAMRFFNGLNLKYQKRIGVYTSFEDLYNRALEHERIEMKDEEFRRKRKGDGMRGVVSKKT
ncbi:uncharacterized protein LOC104903375 [Beta vulgaris subsp. vulgaris]|uniref:uncharacterized protein LOC104903375 n=1 Tax=Beta vulgaris subsp. vulgaris TaxID=3555 RepID=UPI002036D648|nr:uncharacterized protein LOC104903375 [Beta vulgaris subsp. vulgaris]